MNQFKKCLPFALTALAACLSQNVYATPGAPSSGAYVSDAQNTWVQDRVGDRIGTVNMIMCIMSSLRGDAMVNQGPYVALVDQNKCQGRGDSSKSTSTSAGASNATNYMSAVVDSTQASEAAPLIIKAWLHDEEDHGGGPTKVQIYAYIVATAGPSSTNPNGLFEMYFCGVPEGLSSCMFKGALTSDSGGLHFYQNEGSSDTQLILQSNPTADSGQGRITGTDNSTPYAYAFSYDTSNFRRSDGTVDACFARDHTVADYSTWRYGTYQADGSRLEVSNPGFPVKYVDGANTYYGFWSFWGLWLPDSAMANLGSSGTLTRHVGSSDVPLTIEKHPGKLWKLARHSSTLDDFKSTSMGFWAQGTVGALPGGFNYELVWDGSTLQAVSKQDCSGGQCVPQPITPVTLHAVDFTNANIHAVPVFFPSGGGNGAISVPGSGDFASGDTVYYRTRDVVAPSDSSAPSALKCVNMCPLSGSALTTALGSQANPFISTSWGPVATGSAASYTYGSGMLSGTGGTVDASSVAKSSMGNYQWGLTSGSMVDAADLSSVSCDSNGTPNASGSYLCPNLVDQAAVIYQWETGPNQWNQYFGASGVTIDPPKSLHFTVDGHSSPGNIRAADPTKFDGSTVQLQFSGFGELQGVPGGCVDPDTNQATSCSQNTRWVPAFDILDGTSVTDGTSTYYVKYLEREMRLGQLSGAADTACKTALSLSAASSLTLPDASYFHDPRTPLGSEPTPANTKAAVIDGAVQ